MNYFSEDKLYHKYVLTEGTDYTIYTGLQDYRSQSPTLSKRIILIQFLSPSS